MIPTELLHILRGAGLPVEEHGDGTYSFNGMPWTEVLEKLDVPRSQWFELTDQLLGDGMQAADPDATRTKAVTAMLSPLTDAQAAGILIAAGAAETGIEPGPNADKPVTFESRVFDGERYFSIGAVLLAAYAPKGIAPPSAARVRELVAIELDAMEEEDTA
jgi:hypothetical protein